jgi:hypothetical protein
MRRIERSLVRPRFMNMPCRSTSDPPHQFAHHDRAASAENDHGPRLPHQSVDDLIKLRMGHMTESSSFAALLATCFVETCPSGVVVLSGRRSDHPFRL